MIIDDVVGQTQDEITARQNAIDALLENRDRITHIYDVLLLEVLKDDGYSFSLEYDSYAAKYVGTARLRLSYDDFLTYDACDAFRLDYQSLANNCTKLEAVYRFKIEECVSITLYVVCDMPQEEIELLTALGKIATMEQEARPASTYITSMC